MATFGFIGTGNMGGALARAAAKSLAPEEMILSDAYAPVAEALAQELGCKAVPVEEVAAKAKFIWLGVKPQMMGDLLEEIRPVLRQRTDRFVLVSMAAGVSIWELHRLAGAEFPIIRIMPNIPVSVGSGVILYTATGDVRPEELAFFEKNMAGAGLLDRLPERLIDAGSALSGCGPAFVAMFIEALADGAVACGLPSKQSLTYAAQTLIGSAKVVLEKEMHPGQLKDAVCSPGGTTIMGVRALEEAGFRGAAVDAVIAAYEKTLELAD